jgi:hypothetical protein
VAFFEKIILDKKFKKLIMYYFKLVYLFLFIIDFVYGFSLCKFSFSPSLQRICERFEENYVSIFLGIMQM